MWEPLKERLTEVFKSKTQAEWCELMEHTDVCFAPVLRMSDAAKHPHNVERATFVEQFGMTQPAPALASPGPPARSRARRRCPAPTPGPCSPGWGCRRNGSRNSSPRTPSNEVKPSPIRR
ncbi:MAG: CoA transferase [Ilumatobacteraceae bacterium]